MSRVNLPLARRFALAEVRSCIDIQEVLVGKGPLKALGLASPKARIGHADEVA